MNIFTVNQVNQVYVCKYAFITTRFLKYVSAISDSEINNLTADGDAFLYSGLGSLQAISASLPAGGGEGGGEDGGKGITKGGNTKDGPTSGDSNDSTTVQYGIIPTGDPLSEALDHTSSLLSEFLSDPDVPAGALIFDANDKAWWVHQKNPNGEWVRSDLVKFKNVLWGNLTPAKRLRKKLHGVYVALDPNVNSGNPVVGQDYVLRLAFDGYIGISPEDSQYWKYGAVRVTPGMTKSDFYKRMAISLAKNMAREAVKMVDIFIVSPAQSGPPVTFTKVTENTTYESLQNLTVTGIRIAEVEQPWHLGLRQGRSLSFKAIPTEIDYYAGNFLNTACWGITANAITGEVPNGKLLADYEWFFHGERGDQYRLMGWPNVVFTKYLVNPSSEYSTLGFHFAYVGQNECVQKSEKDITILGEMGILFTITSLFVKESHLKDKIKTQMDKLNLDALTVVSNNTLAGQFIEQNRESIKPTGPFILNELNSLGQDWATMLTARS